MLSKADIKQIKSLDQKKIRQERQEFIIEGPKMVAELMTGSGPFYIKRLYVQEGALESPRAPVVKYVTASEMERISFQAAPSGALAVVGIPQIPFASPHPGGLYLALDGVRDPGNFGTILRLADWFNIRTVYASPDCVELYNPKTVQSTMGAILRVPVHYTPLVPLLGNCTLPVLGTVLQGGTDINTLFLPSEGVIVMGNESQGISEQALEHIQIRLYIPSYREGSESLNVATAAAIVCAAFCRNLPPRPR
ncbi:MAG: RNA methyltransferase [Bacteroidales bacterium]|jgi:TrmH family RNA methyltransferase|nr:RNA methyltransferase [Bacteroidales bacterium]MDD2264501.1 RNA methyltransferase [Bacteroidales bacterium]MDD2831736.1 RNA methyltransferase [Bacteroidales bacterium]MDD3208963.1 RNA methyltransferase [Bacteroidales bacterium]MDD3697665.1 RNA methyltransferase [Bacteroidales bacterium]